MLRRIWQTLWGATLWRRSKPCVKPTRLSVPHWAQLKPTLTNWQNWTNRSRATRWCPIPTPGSPWRPWRRPGGTCRRSSRLSMIEYVLLTFTNALLLAIPMTSLHVHIVSYQQTLYFSVYWKYSTIYKLSALSSSLNQLSLPFLNFCLNHHCFASLYTCKDVKCAHRQWWCSVDLCAFS